MQPRHHVSSAAVELIKRFEGYRRAAAQLSDGRWTIGYGHTRSAREGASVDEDDASALLLYDLGEVSVALNAVIFTPLNQNQFDALVSFAMNIGIEDFRRSSVLLRVNEGALLQAAAALELWRKADFEGERIVVDALVRRRAAEKALFLTPIEGFVPTPTPVVRPRIDYAAGLVAPAVQLTTLLEGQIAEARRGPTEDQNAAPPVHEAEPSAAEAAAATVSARLQAILEDLELVEAAPAPVAEPASAVEAFPQEPPIVLPLPDPSAHARRHREEEPAETAPALESAVQEQAGEVEPFPRADLSGPPALHGPASYLPLALMLVIGVALLAVATYWFVHAHPRMGAVAPSVIGWVLGLTGVGLLAASIYFLLERIGEQDDG